MVNNQCTLAVTHAVHTDRALIRVVVIIIIIIMQDNIYSAVIMTKSLREFTLAHLMDELWLQAAADPGPSQST